MALDKSKLDALRIEEHQRSGGSGVGRVLLWLVPAIVVAGGFAAWLLLGGDDAPAPTEIRTAEALSPRSAEAGVLDASGYVVARRLATVSSKVTGRIEEVFIEEGMEVAAGDLLATLDDSSLRPLLALAQSQLEAARLSLSETRVRLDEAERQLHRTQELRARNLVSEAELDAAQAEVDALSARLDAARSNVDVAARTVALREQDLIDLEIRAPFDGVVVAKNAQPGEMISPVSAGGGFTRTGIGTIVDMASREIEVDVNEAFINRVESGQRVVATLDAYTDWEIPASVINIVPTADRQRATVKVRIAFDALDARILPDMGVKVRFLEADSEPREEGPELRATVPSAAVRNDNGQDYVWLVRGGVIERRAVSTDGRAGSRVGIVAGLAPGDRVVTSTGIELEEGMAVGE
jgi:RND family efflux transporter MFP subunit